MKKYGYNINLFLVSFVIIFITFFSSCNKELSFLSKYPPIKIFSYNENGQEYEIEAISGQVIVIFNNTIPNSQAVQEIKQNNGKIIGKIDNLRYYLVDTGVGNEINFINKINKSKNIKYVFFNSVEYPCKIDPQTYVIDNFNISHGDNVKYTLKECGFTKKINAYNVGIKGDEEGRMSWSEIDRDLTSILSFPTKDTPLIINMSFGPSFIDPNIDFWTDKEITDEIKKNYIQQYIKNIKHIVKVTSDYKDKDFIIIKAAGNEGLKQLDTEILNYLGKEFTNDEIKFLNEHFILVGAEDSRDTKYSNTVTKGKYNFLYTSVDISDLKKENENLYGTSFAAPRVSCFISTAVNDNDIKATEALKVIKDITRRNPNAALTQELINKDVKIITDSRKKTKETAAKPSKDDSVSNNKSNGENTSDKSNSVKKIKAPNNIEGTKWEYKLPDFKPGGFGHDFKVVEQTIEFQNNNQVEITSFFGTGSSEINHVYNYYYDEKVKKWRMYKTSPVQNLLKMNDEEDKELALKMGNYFFISISKNKLTLTDPFGVKTEYVKTK